MNLKVAATLALLLGSTILIVALCSNQSGSHSPATNPTPLEKGTNGAAPLPPEWIATYREVAGQSGGRFGDDQFKSLVSLIAADQDHVRWLTALVTEAHANKELLTISDILDALVRKSAKFEYIELATAIEARSETLPPRISSAFVCEHYGFNEVQEFMLPILLEGPDDLTDIHAPPRWLAASRWLRGAWEKEPFPEALAVNQAAFLAQLDSIQNKRFAERAKNLLHEARFFDFLLSLIKIGAIECDEALARLESVLARGTGSMMRDEKENWRVPLIREACQ